jgi:hypothetical protein
VNGEEPAGLSTRIIYQDLVEQNDFRDAYQSVQRFIRKVKTAQPRRIWRMEARPGEEVQVNFGLGASIDDGARLSWKPNARPLRKQNRR